MSVYEKWNAATVNMDIDAYATLFVRNQPTEAFVLLRMTQLAEASEAMKKKD